MGTLKSYTNFEGIKINNITLGSPVQEYDENGEVIENSMFCWDHPRIPNGTIEDDGTITINEEDINV